MKAGIGRELCNAMQRTTALRPKAMSKYKKNEYHWDREELMEIMNVSE
jgi:hypothetical protein